MTYINTALEEQTGGWYNVAIISISDINCPDLLTNANASNIVITPTANALDILPVGENIVIQESSQKTKSGIIYNIKGEFEIPYQSEQIDDYFNNHLQAKVVFIGIKHSGQKKIYGSKKFPLAFQYQFINGKKYEDGNRIKVSVYGKIPQKPVFMPS